MADFIKKTLLTVFVCLAALLGFRAGAAAENRTGGRSPDGTSFTFTLEDDAEAKPAPPPAGDAGTGWYFLLPAYLSCGILFADLRKKIEK